MHEISVVINTLNEERNIERAIKSVKWADETIVCDMHSEDKTVQIAKGLGAKIFFHKKEGFVEPARNFAISKALYEWILILDADEEVPGGLAKKLIEIVSKMEQIDYVKLPRKNLIFGHFMQASMWWPDLNIRFFKRGKVKWVDKIHRPPQAFGVGLNLPATEEYALIHHNYDTVSQFIERMNKYTDIQAEELFKDNYQFHWQDLLEKPLNEFLSRFFAGEGYKDGLHGLALSFLQAFSFVVVYLKIWEKRKFLKREISIKEFSAVKDKQAIALDYWFNRATRVDNSFSKLLKKFWK